MKKKFKINKKFEIHRGNKGEWSRQTDSNSCGYHLVHNSQPHLQIQNYEGNPEGVYQAINAFREQNGQESLPRDSNLPTSDLSNYFTNKGLKVEPMSNPVLDKENLQSILDERNFDLMFLTSNRHYTGIVKENDQLLYLDSLTNGPSIITEDQARSKISASLGNRNLVGVVNKARNKFVVNS